MLNKIKAFLYAVTHASGRVFGVKVHLGPFCLTLWVGREEAAVVRFAIDVEFVYDTPGDPLLDASVEVGVIKVELSLSRSYLA